MTSAARMTADQVVPGPGMAGAEVWLLWKGPAPDEEDPTEWCTVSSVGEDVGPYTMVFHAADGTVVSRWENTCPAWVSLQPGLWVELLTAEFPLGAVRGNVVPAPRCDLNLVAGGVRHVDRRDRYTVQYGEALTMAGSLGPDWPILVEWTLQGPIAHQWSVPALAGSDGKWSVTFAAEPGYLGTWELELGGGVPGEICFNLWPAGGGSITLDLIAGSTQSPSPSPGPSAPASAPMLPNTAVEPTARAGPEGR